MCLVLHSDARTSEAYGPERYRPRRGAEGRPNASTSSSGHGGLTAGAQVVRKLVRQIARPDAAHGLIQIVLDPDELHGWCPVANLQQNVSGAPVPVLGPPDAAGVHE